MGVVYKAEDIRLHRFVALFGRSRGSLPICFSVATPIS
jgi:hypothetical protein